MKTGTRLGALFLLLPVFVLITGCTARIIRISDMTEIKMHELIDEIRGFRLVFVGEAHNEGWHHETQLKIIKALHEKNVPVAIGLEMFRSENQDTLNKWVAGDVGKKEFVSEYYKNWNVPWSKYEDIFMFARENRIPLIGLNIPRKIIQQVVKEGFESLTPEQMKEIPGAKCEVDKEYEDFIKRALEGHDMKEQSFKRFCEAQMVWDSSMALKSVDYLDANPDKTMVVLAGSGHSWRRGIPAQVKKLSELSFVVVLPESKSGIHTEEVTAEDADYLWLGSLLDSLK